MFNRKKFENHYEGVVEPFKIIGNIYYVGTYPASSHLIDTGYEDTLFLLINSIYKLGFSPYDVKHIIHTHWHGDHTGGTAAFAHLTGAKTYIGENDCEAVKRYFTPDVLLKDGDVLRIGNTEFEVMETPGHTKGTISLFFETSENGVKYKVGTFGGAGANTLAKGRFDYDNCRADYLESLNKLRERKVEVFLGNHVWNNDTEEKGKILVSTGENKFIDSEIWNKFIDFCENRLYEVIAKD